MGKILRAGAIVLMLMVAGALPTSVRAGGATELWSVSAASEVVGMPLVSHDGATIFTALRGDDLVDFTARDVETGDLSWQYTYEGESVGWGGVYQGLSPDGDTLFAAFHEDFDDYTPFITVVSLDAEAGTLLWAQSYVDPQGTWGAEPNALLVSPDGALLNVVGYGGRTGRYLTLSIAAETGDLRWMRRYKPVIRPKHGEVPSALDVASSPSGRAIYVLGNARNGEHMWDWNVLAYSARTGRLLWVTHWAPPSEDHVAGLLVNDRGQVLVFGTATRSWGWRHWGIGQRVVVRLDPSTGTVEGVTELAGGDEFFAQDWDVDLERHRIYLAGAMSPSGTFEVRAFNLGTGNRVWTYRLKGTGRLTSEAWDVASGPMGVAATGGVGLGKVDHTASRVTVALSHGGAQLWKVERSVSPSSVDYWSWAWATPTSDGIVVTTEDLDGAALIHADAPA